MEQIVVSWPVMYGGLKKRTTPKGMSMTMERTCWQKRTTPKRMSMTMERTQLLIRLLRLAVLVVVFRSYYFCQCTRQFTILLGTIPTSLKVLRAYRDNWSPRPWKFNELVVKGIDPFIPRLTAQ